MGKYQLINRTKYKDIKKYDHHQMECFLKSLYESGLKDGAEQAIAKMKSGKEQVDFDLLKEKLLSVKGIGIVKADNIIKVLKEILE